MLVLPAFAALPDPRSGHARRHKLLDALTIALEEQRHLAGEARLVVLEGEKIVGAAVEVQAIALAG